MPTAEAPVAETMAGIRRDAADQGALPAKKLAATADLLHQILAPIPDDLRGRRDRALLLVGFAGALRRAELAAIRVEHLEPRERGLRLTLPRSKGERDGKAVTVALPLRHDRALPGARPAPLAGGGRHHRGPGVPPHLDARPQAARGGKAPCPAPSSAASRSIRAASPASSRRAPPRPASTAPRSAATASSAAPSPPGWSAASTRPGSSNSAGTRATPCSTSISSSAIRSSRTP